MDWKKERDALIAQTMAFVQSVAGRMEPSAAPRAAIPPSPPRQPAMSPAPSDRPEVGFKPAEADKPKTAGTTRPEPLAPLSLPSLQKDLKREIQDRIASFRAHQERFNRERAEYFNATLAKLRASLEEEGAARDRGK